MASESRLRPATDTEIERIGDAVFNSKTYAVLRDAVQQHGYSPHEQGISVHAAGEEFIASIPVKTGESDVTVAITIEVIGDAVINGCATIDVAGYHSQAGPTTYLKVTEEFDVYEYTVGDGSEE